MTPEYKKLRRQIEEARDAYYVNHTPTLTDAEYDELVRRLAKLETELHIDDPTSPTRDVGSDLATGFKKVPHISKMLSLDNIFTAEEVGQFFKEANLPLVVEPKIDGLSLELRYQAGSLVQAVTRGNGAEGDDVTAQAKTIASIPQTIPTCLLPVGDLRVRGEVYMRRSVFTQLNKEREAAGDDLLKNPRNAASGSLKQKDPAETAKRKLDYLAYWAAGFTAPSDTFVLAQLKKIGFTIPDVQIVPAVKAYDAIKRIEAMRDSLDYDTDGAVLKVDDLKLREELGEGTHAPKWAIAFKFPPERKVTKLLDIVVTVGKTGQVCPNAVLAPVQLSGATVTAASLMNQDEYERIGSPAIGDDVFVERSAEVIPRVCGVAKRHDGPAWQWPTACPSCGNPLHRDGVHWFCGYSACCPEQIKARLVHAVGKQALDWDGCGEATVDILIQCGATKLIHLFKLSEHFVGQHLKGAAASKFLAERERVKQAPLWRKLNALGFEGIGRRLSKELAQRYGSLLNLAQHAEELPALIGPQRAMGLLAALTAQADELEELEKLGFVLADVTTDGAKPLAGLSFVITGTLVSGSRDQVAAKIEAKGGLIKSSVSKTTSYLVAGESPGHNKTEAAAKHGTRVLDEAALYQLMGEPLVPATANTDEKEY